MFPLEATVVLFQMFNHCRRNLLFEKQLIVCCRCFQSCESFHFLLVPFYSEIVLVVHLCLSVCCFMADLRPLASSLPLAFHSQQPTPVSGTKAQSCPASWSALGCCLFVVAPSGEVMALLVIGLITFTKEDVFSVFVFLGFAGF